MERREFSKSTVSEVEEYRKLFKEGMTIGKIRQKFGKDYTTIAYWIKKGNGYAPTENRGGDRKTGHYRLKRDAKKALLRALRIGNKCLICCRAKRNKKWRTTDYCGIICWEKEHERKQPIKIDPIWAKIRV